MRMLDYSTCTRFPRSIQRPLRTPVTTYGGFGGPTKFTLTHWRPFIKQVGVPAFDDVDESRIGYA